MKAWAIVDKALGLPMEIPVRLCEADVRFEVKAFDLKEDAEAALSGYQLHPKLFEVREVEIIDAKGNKSTPAVRKTKAAGKVKSNGGADSAKSDGKKPKDGKKTKKKA